MIALSASFVVYNRGAMTDLDKARRAVAARGTCNPLPTKAERKLVKADRSRRKRERHKANKRKRIKQPKSLPQFVGTYYEYLKSPQWKAKCKLVKKHYGGACTICYRKPNLNVHHRHYRTLFREQMEDLDLLCYGCHQNTHEQDKGAVDPVTERFLSLSF